MMKPALTNIKTVDEWKTFDARVKAGDAALINSLKNYDSKSFIKAWTGENIIFDLGFSAWTKSATYNVFVHNREDNDKDQHKVAREYFSSMKRRFDDRFRARCKKMISDGIEERNGELTKEIVELLSFKVTPTLKEWETKCGHAPLFKGLLQSTVNKSKAPNSDEN